MSTLTIGMRQRDRLPLISVAVENDIGQPLNLTSATKVEMCFRMVDGTQLFAGGYPYAGTDWYARQVTVIDANTGVVAYDWSKDEADNVRVGIIELAVRVQFPDGEIVAPTDHQAYIVMRPVVIPPPAPVPGSYGYGKYGTGIYDDPTPA